MGRFAAWPFVLTLVIETIIEKISMWQNVAALGRSDLVLVLAPVSRLADIINAGEF